MGTDFVEDMAVAALFPRSRRVVLGLLYGQPDRKFYLRELVDRTGLGVGNMQRELARLTQGGLVKRWREGRHVYFQASQACPVYKELTALITKTVGMAGIIRDALLPLESRIHSAFVYGSVARGEARESSDVDLLVIGQASFAQVTALVRPLETKLGREINPTVFPARELCAKAAAGSHFVTSVLKAPKLFILGNEDELERLLAQPLDPSA